MHGATAGGADKTDGGVRVRGGRMLDNIGDKGGGTQAGRGGGG